MRTIVSLAIAAGLLALPASAKPPKVNPEGEAKLAKLLQGRVAGKPVDCLQLRDLSDSQVIDGTAIVYRVGADQLYVNRPDVGAESLDYDDILVTDTHTSELCRIDTVRLIDRGSRFERGFVGLGMFVPYTRPRKN